MSVRLALSLKQNGGGKGARDMRPPFAPPCPDLGNASRGMGVRPQIAISVGTGPQDFRQQ